MWCILYVSITPENTIPLWSFFHFTEETGSNRRLRHSTTYKYPPTVAVISSTEGHSNFHSPQSGDLFHLSSKRNRSDFLVSIRPAGGLQSPVSVIREEIVSFSPMRFERTLRPSHARKTSPIRRNYWWRMWTDILRDLESKKRRMSSWQLEKGSQRFDVWGKRGDECHNLNFLIEDNRTIDVLRKLYETITFLIQKPLKMIVNNTNYLIKRNDVNK